MIGDQITYRSYGFMTGSPVVSGRRAYSALRSRTETDGGALNSENADTSRDKPGENPGRRKPKVSWARFVLPGLAGS